ncbi:MAG: hypothetical protein ABW034_22965 [Steroidobacteraceae bacterium]
MACCAFVAFLVSQLYVLGRGVKRLFSGKPQSEVDAASMWRLDTSDAPTAPAAASQSVVQRRSPLKRAGWAVAVVAEIAVVVVAGHWLVARDGAQSVAAELHHIASGHGLAHLRDLLNR